MRDRLMTVRSWPLLLALPAFLLAGCDNPPARGHANDVVFAREVRTGRLNLKTYHLCVGGSRATCEWKQLHGKRKRVRYNRCQIGEHYPACRRGGR